MPTKTNQPATSSLVTKENGILSKKRLLLIIFGTIVVIAAIIIPVAIIFTKKEIETSTKMTTKTKIEITTKMTTKTEVKTTTTTEMPKINLVINGNAETGYCETNSGLMHPLGWNYNGTVTQIFYTSPYLEGAFMDPFEPKDHGRCFFHGQHSSLTSMWQTVNLIDSSDLFLIDNLKMKFILSAWIGGYGAQDDRVLVSLTFFNQTIHKLGESITIGPIWASDRETQTKLLFRNETGLVPISTRFLEIDVTFIRSQVINNDGYVDNIFVALYQ